MAIMDPNNEQDQVLDHDCINRNVDGMLSTRLNRISPHVTGIPPIQKNFVSHLNNYNTFHPNLPKNFQDIAELQYKDYSNMVRMTDIPRKDTSKHIGLDVKDIQGAGPKNLKAIRGKRRQDFFPNNNVMNKYYNKEALHGSLTG